MAAGRGVYTTALDISDKHTRIRFRRQSSINEVHEIDALSPASRHLSHDEKAREEEKDARPENAGVTYGRYGTERAHQDQHRRQHRYQGNMASVTLVLVDRNSSTSRPAVLDLTQECHEWASYAARGLTHSTPGVAYYTISVGGRDHGGDGGGDRGGRGGTEGRFSTKGVLGTATLFDLGVRQGDTVRLEVAKPRARDSQARSETDRGRETDHDHGRSRGRGRSAAPAHARSHRHEPAHARAHARATEYTADLSAADAETAIVTLRIVDDRGLERRKSERRSVSVDLRQNHLAWAWSYTSPSPGHERDRDQFAITVSRRDREHLFSLRNSDTHTALGHLGIRDGDVVTLKISRRR